MRQQSRTAFQVTFILLLSCVTMFAQRRASSIVANSYNGYRVAPTYMGGWYGGWGGYPAFGGNGLYASVTSPLDVPPKYWWVSPYPSENPCQAGCNPNAGYEWDSVGTLILNTNPPKARVTLDGIYAGTTDKLGPFQLPVGRHTLHIEATGFEPSDIIVKFDQPGVQDLNIELKHLRSAQTVAPR